MAITYTAERYFNRPTAQTATTVFSPATTCTAGSTLILAVCAGASKTVSSVTDSVGGNTWVVDATDTAGSQSKSIVSCVVTNAITSAATITITWSAATSQALAVFLEEFAGLAASPSFDKKAANNASGTAFTSGSTGTLTQANEVAIVIARAGAASTWAKGTSWSYFTTHDDATNCGLEYQIVAATTALNADGTWGTTNNWSGMTATYKASSGSPPVNTVAPAVTGTTTVGSVLTSDTGTWTTVSPVYTYQWQRDVAGNGVFSNIGSATSSTYTLVDLDDGNKIRCVVTDTDAGGATSANSNAVGLVLEPGVPVNTVAPVVSGTTTVGQVLTSTAGTFTNFAGSVHTTAYQWQRDVFGNSSYSNIAAATSSTYTLVDADDACNIRCVVTATNDVGSSTGTNSNVVGTVIEPAPTNSVVPALGGTNANVGQAITSTTGTWANMGGHGPTFTYQWKDSATSGGAYSNIAGATASSYTVGAGEIGLFLKCFVTAHNTNGSTATANTVASNAVGAAVGPGAGVNMMLLGAG